MNKNRINYCSMCGIELDEFVNISYKPTNPHSFFIGTETNIYLCQHCADQVFLNLAGQCQEEVIQIIDND